MGNAKSSAEELDEIFRQHYIGKRVRTPYGEGVAIAWIPPGFLSPVKLVVKTDTGFIMEIDSTLVCPIKYKP